MLTRGGLPCLDTQSAPEQASASAYRKLAHANLQYTTATSGGPPLTPVRLSKTAPFGPPV